MREVDKLIETLHPLERAVLPLLKENVNLDLLKDKTKLQEVEVMRALQWLENKKVVVLKRDVKELIVLDKNGELYLKEGLPEKRFIQAVKEGASSLRDVKEKAGLDDDELNVSLGMLRAKNAITFSEGKVGVTDDGTNSLEDASVEDFLRSLPVAVHTLDAERKKLFEELRRRRNFVGTKLDKIVYVSLTELGKELAKHDMKDDLLEALTPNVLRNKEWKLKKLRRYDVVINVPKVYPSKRHFVNQAIDYIKQIWLEMGFKEMTGPMLETSFWNFDALFVPQDHPAREMQDTFYVKGKGHAADKRIVNNVKEAHENGFKTGSSGWGYKWNPEKARQLVLRTHTTPLSARTLANLKTPELPAKFFTVGKCFRNEAVDWKHSIEFDQTEGIVIDSNVNFRHLLGYLRQFFSKMGFEDIRFRPGFFPYVEPGLECEVYHPVRKEWIELGGAGIFRPEVVKPLLGKDIPVLAWGLGLGRLIMDYYDIKDLRDFHSNDLQQLRTMKVWMK